MKHSKNYNKVKNYYVKGYWSIEWVRNAVGKWITAAEFTQITGQEYEENTNETANVE